MVIDLDPGEGAGLSECAVVALLVRERVESRRGLGAAYAVTSGSKGMHLYVSLPGKKNPSEVTELAKEIADELAEEHPKQVTATMTKARRSGKVFLDWSQNSGSKTTLSPYSLRGKERPYAATPITWDEVEEAAGDPVALEQFRFEEVLERVDELGDLLAELDADVS
jgi:bifunctional non-homologous end joining protein LigD